MVELLIIFDMLLRAIGFAVLSAVLINTIYKLFRTKDKSPVDGLVYGQSTKKPFMVRVRKLFKNITERV